MLVASRDVLHRSLGLSDVISAVETKQPGIVIGTAETKLSDNFGRDCAERNAVRSVSEGVERLRAVRHGPDVRKSVPSLAEGTSPHERRFGCQGRQPCRELFLEPAHPAWHEMVAQSGVFERRIRAADHYAPVFRGTHV